MEGQFECGYSVTVLGLFLSTSSSLESETDSTASRSCVPKSNARSHLGLRNWSRDKNVTPSVDDGPKTVRPSRLDVTVASGNRNCFDDPSQADAKAIALALATIDATNRRFGFRILTTRCKHFILSSLCVHFEFSCATD
jgi:hypothetical protein